MAPVIAGHRWMFKDSSLLATNPDSCLSIVDGSIDLQIPISHLTQMDKKEEGIREALASHINYYSDSLKGILISYTKLRLNSPNVDLCEYPNEEEEVTVHGTFVVFRPEKGATLQGVITRVNPHHIGCLVMKTFTASIRSSSGSNVNFEDLYIQGEEITFVVEKLLKDGFCRLIGFLTDDMIVSHRNCRPSGSVFRNIDDVYSMVTQETIKNKARKTQKATEDAHHHHHHHHHHRERTAVSPDSGISPGTDTSLPFSSLDDVASSTDITSTHKKKRKKSKRESMESVEIPSVGENPTVLDSLGMEVLSERKKKKKRHHDEIAMTESSDVPLPDEQVAEDLLSPPSKKRKKHRHAHIETWTD